MENTMLLKMFTCLSSLATFNWLIQSSSADITPAQHLILNATSYLQEKTMQNFFKSKCLVVHYGFDEFNATTHAEESFLGEDYKKFAPHIDVNQLTQDCPDGTYITVSAPMQSHSYQLGSKLYVGIETTFEIEGTLNLMNIRDSIKSSTAFLIPEDQPSVAVKVNFHNETNVCVPTTLEDASNDVDNRVVFLNMNQSTHQQTFSLKYTVIVETPGIFSVVGALEFVLADGLRNTTSLLNATAHVVKYWDDAKFLHYYYPPDVSAVSLPARIIAYLVIGIVSSIELTLLVLTIKHRNKTIMKMSQGNCLIVLLTTAIFVSISSVLLNPKNVLHCNLRGLFLYVPLQFYISILCGRLWRITSIMAPLLNWGKGKDEDNAVKRKLKQIGEQIMAKCACVFEKINYDPQRNKNIRVTITNTQLWIMICFLTLPQFLIQVIFLATNPQELYILYNSDQTIGLYQCRSDLQDKSRKYFWASTAFLLIGPIFTLIFANKSSSLPSVFDEAAIVYSSVIIMVIVFLIGISLNSFTNEAEISPNVTYLIMVLCVNIITLIPSWRVMYPKLKLIKSGKTITMNSLLMEHRQLQKEKFTREEKAPAEKNVTRKTTLEQEKNGDFATELSTTIINQHVLDENTAHAVNNQNEGKSDLVHAMMDTMSALSELNQRHLNGLEVQPSEWADLCSVVSKLNDILKTKNVNMNM